MPKLLVNAWKLFWDSFDKFDTPLFEMIIIEHKLHLELGTDYFSHTNPFCDKLFV